MNDEDRRFGPDSGDQPKDEGSFFDKPGSGPTDVPVAGSQPGAGVDGGIRKPADYYSQDVPHSPSATQQPYSPDGTPPPGAPTATPATGRKGCPPWLMGCGVAVVLGVILIIGLGWWAFSSGRVFTMVFDSVGQEIEKSADIDAETRRAISEELEELKRHIEDDELQMADLQAPMTSIQAMLADQEIDQQEADELLETLQALNDRASREEF